MTAEKVYFMPNMDGDDGPFTLEQVKKEVAYIRENASGDGWPEDIEDITIYVATPIAKFVETDRDKAIPCEVCSGGNIDEWDEMDPENGCPGCDGADQVSQNTGEPWLSEYDEVVEYKLNVCTDFDEDCLTMDAGQIHHCQNDWPDNGKCVFAPKLHPLDCTMCSKGASSND